MKLTLEGFKGAIPQLPPVLLPAQYAQHAENCRLDEGYLRPLLASPAWARPVPLVKQGPIKGLYRFLPVAGDPSSGYLFHWTARTQVAGGFLRGDAQHAVVFTSEGDRPRITDATIATANTDYPSASYWLGVPAPTTQIEAALVQGTGQGDDDDRVERNYIVIYESYWTSQRFEGPPAQDGQGNILFSPTVKPLPGQKVLLTNLPSEPAGSWKVTHVGIFRLSGNQYRRVTRVPIGTTSYEDAIAEEGLGEALPSADFHPPPAELHHVGVLSNGMAYGAHKDELAISYPYLIHAWGPNNRYPLGAKVMACAHIDATLYAFTHEGPFLLSGNDPRSMYVEQVPVGQGCASAESVCVTRHGVSYASPEGLFLLQPGRGWKNLTEGFLLPEQWRAYKPASMLCAAHEDWLLVFWDKGTLPVQRGCLVFRLDQPDFGIVEVPDLFATAAYADPLLDALVLAPPYTGGVPVKPILFQGGDTSSTHFKWRGGLMQAERPVCYQAGRVWSRDYSRPLTLRLYNEAADLLHTQTITSERAFRLPGGYRARAVQVEIEGTQEVLRVELAESLSELAR